MFRTRGFRRTETRFGEGRRIPRGIDLARRAILEGRSGAIDGEVGSGGASRRSAPRSRLFPLMPQPPDINLSN